MPHKPRATVPHLTLFTPRPLAARRSEPSLIDVALDAAQRTAVERAPGRALLVLGEAGHGKTTVALHRVAHLWSASPTPLRAAVVVPTEGLARMLQPLLRRLGVDVEALTYDRWAGALARRAFRRLPRESDATPPSVMRLKRHPALRLALEELATREAGRIDDERDAPARARARVTRGDLQHLFGDGALLERVARAGTLPQLCVSDTLERTRVQFSPTAEEEWAHVTDRQRLVAVDHRALDEATATESARTVDVEDYAVLFELDRLRAAVRTEPAFAPKAPYDVLMIDEAQELAPLELALLGRTVKAGGTLIVAGDAHQQTDPSSVFGGWEATMRELGFPDHDTVQLEIGYRCPPDVVALARTILEPAPALLGPVATGVHAFRDAATLHGWLASGVHELLRRDRRASVAVVCRSPLTARRVAGALRAAQVPARLVFDGHFLPRGPVQVSLVAGVKGLEFDFVVVPDAGAIDYPDEPAARRALYVAVTRARHEVALACVGTPSPLVPAAARE